ncbi:hypothetical protein LTS18_010787, partial [Coniosporium uncinatum]
MSGYLETTKAARNRTKAGSDSAASQTATTRSSNDTTETKKARLRDSAFRQTVLTPRGTSFPPDKEYSDAYAHFNTQPPSNGTAGYSELERGRHTDVWLSANDIFVKEIVREYQYMRMEQLCEAEFATYAVEKLLRRDPRFLDCDE